MQFLIGGSAKENLLILVALSFGSPWVNAYLKGLGAHWVSRILTQLPILTLAWLLASRLMSNTILIF